jgi:hypothetical protein
LETRHGIHHIALCSLSYQCIARVAGEEECLLPPKQDKIEKKKIVHK